MCKLLRGKFLEEEEDDEKEAKSGKNWSPNGPTEANTRHSQFANLSGLRTSFFHRHGKWRG
jgi:hypothetical protein